MKSAKKMIAYLVGYLYVICRILFKSSVPVNNGHVLIIQGGNIGDALIDAKNVLSLVEYYKKQGKKVTVAGKKAAIRAYESLVEVSAVDVFVIENVTLYLGSIKKTLSGLKKDGYEVIVSLLPWNNWFSLYIPACLPCNESWGAFPHKNRRVFKYFLSRSYTNRLVVPIDMHQMQRSKLLIRAIGISDFQTGFITIPPKGRETRVNNYIVLSVDSANPVRGWAPENFIGLAGRLLERYPYDICLTGVNVEPGVLRQYEQSFIGNDRVKVTIGKLSIDEWVETIRGSWFVVSRDSGTAHIAAGTGTACFCLTGVWDGHRIMPYAVDKPTPGTKEPICVYRTDVNAEELKCYNCYGKRHIGWGNKECSAQCKKRLPCLCMSKITVDDVMSAIEKAEHDGEISR